MYNVRAYARDCLESLRCMTPLPGEAAEIVIVDDGSTDGTGDIIDSFLQPAASTWPRSVKVIVLHNPNQGLSSARNAGVACAQGLYISFVDGDDTVCPDYLNALYDGLLSLGGINANHPLVIGKPNNSRGLTRTHTVPAIPRDIRTLTTTQTLNAALTGAIPINAWAKLAPRKHYLTHPYPAQQTYEDLATLVVLLEDSDQVAILKHPIYCYRRRSDSLSHPQHPTILQVHDFLNALDAFSRSCERTFGRDVDLCKLRYQLSLQYMRLHRLVRLALRYPASTSEQSELHAIDTHIVGEVLKIGSEAVKADGIGRIAALRIRLFCLSRPLYDRIFDCYERIRRHD